MKIGLVLGADYLPFKKAVEIAKFADNLGYTQISVPEIWAHDQISLLSVIAHETSSISIASGIMNMYSRTPALAAMTAASLSEFSSNRFILGLGLSGPKVVENLHGRSFSKPLSHTRDFVAAVRTLLNYERLNLDSKTLGKMQGFKLGFKPVTPDIPIHIASIGPKNIELTAEIADGWIPIMMPAKSLKEKVSEIMEKRERLSLKNQFTITPFILSLQGSDEKTKKLLKAHLGYYLGGMGTFYNKMLARAGFKNEADIIFSKFQKGDVLGAYSAITDEILSAVCLFGSKNQLIENMANYQKINGIVPLLTFPFKSSPEQIKNTLLSLEGLL